MQIVIDIPEEEYEFCKRQWDTECLDVLMTAVKYGTPLPDDAIIIDAKEQSNYVFIEKAKYNDLVEAASKALTDRIKKSLHEGVIAESEEERK